MTSSARLPAGKLPQGALQTLLARLSDHDPRLLVPPAPGEDAAVLDVGGGRCLVLTTDPITFATDRIGWYAVHVNANDVATLGAAPRWFLAVLLLPLGQATADLADTIFEDIRLTSSALGVSVIGGHTEITSGIDRPLVIGQMIGEVERARLVVKRSLEPGDVVLLTRGAAIEGTAILARERREQLEALVPAELLDRAARLLFDPGISIVPAARIASDLGAVRAMHDPTEGGIVGGLAELAGAADVGLDVDVRAIPVLPETRALCDALALDPLRLVASGALLAGVPPTHASALLDAWSTAGITATRVAVVTAPGQGAVLTDGAVRRPLVAPARDELARFFEAG